MTSPEARRRFMEAAVAVSLKSVPEARPEPTPMVGAIVAVGDKELARAYRGEAEAGAHGEFSVLEKLKGIDLTEATIYVTLEPCTHRNPPKKECAKRIIESGIRSVVVGMIDPNRTIQGDGFWMLREGGIDVSFFDQDLLRVIELENAEFIKHHRPVVWTPPSDLRTLDDWYNTVNSIYLDKNSQRSPEFMLAHIVETIGGLSTLASAKSKPQISAEGYIAKCLGWWFALCGVVGIRSVEEMVWSKFPGVCTYCLRRPHNDRNCKQPDTVDRNPNWPELAKLASTTSRPRTINDWKKQFDEIYPGSQSESYDKIFARLAEELGELAECVRVLEVLPTAFLSEAADVFAWLMKFANYHEVRTRNTLDLSDLLWQAYPDRCKECKARVCQCPPILPSTVHRISHEGPSVDSLLSEARWPFLSPIDKLARFEISSKSLSIGDKEIAVDSDALSQIYEIAREVQFAVRNAPEFVDSFRNSYDAWATSVVKLATSQRLSQRSIDDFLRLVTASSLADRAVINEVLRHFEKSLLAASIARYIDQLNALNDHRAFS